MENPIAGDRNLTWKPYAVAFVITSLLFITAFGASTYFSDVRVRDIRAAQDDISTDILSIETQFDLLQEHSCKDVGENTILPSALSSLGNQLSYMEAQGSGASEEVVRLKRLYSLLEIKDYLLMKQLSLRCNLKPVFILYFYSNKGDCEECESQGYVLTALAAKYPQLRIYSFDYNLDVAALQSLIAIDDVAYELPALRINSKSYYGLHKMSDIERILPQLKTLEQSTSTATTTKTRTKK
jgi:hypothetical protein